MQNERVKVSGHIMGRNVNENREELRSEKCSLNMMGICQVYKYKNAVLEEFNEVKNHVVLV